MNIGKCFMKTGLLFQTRRFYSKHNLFLNNGVHKSNNASREPRQKVENDEYEKPLSHEELQKINRYLPKHHFLRKKNVIDPPHFIYLRALGTGAYGTPRGVVIMMPHYRYIFNCGEDSARIFTDFGLRFGSLDKMFFTRNSWENIAGSVGLCLQLFKSSAPFITVYGPPKSDVALLYSKFDIIQHKFHIDNKELPEDGIKDESMDIDVIKLLPVRKGEKSITSKRDIAVAYVCKPFRAYKDIPLHKFIEYGIPRAGTIRRLFRGQSAIIEGSGKEITLDDLFEDTEPNCCFIVLECPTVQHIESVINSKKLSSSYWKEMYISKQKETLSLIIHYTPDVVFQHPEYQKWLNSFGEDTHHWVFNENCSSLVHSTIYSLQGRLNLIHPEIFPLLNPPKVPDNPVTATNLTYGDPGMQFILRKKGDEYHPIKNPEGTSQFSPHFTREYCYNLDYDAITKPALENEKFKQVLDEVKSELQQLKESDMLDKREYPEIVFLGTCSAIATKMRNFSAILVHLSPDQCMLLDCGDATISQLFRLYGNETYNILVKLKAVFVSHLHTDHHLGLVGIIEARKAAMERLGMRYVPLQLIAPSEIINLIKKIGMHIVPIINLIRLVGNERLLHTETDVVSRKLIIKMLNLKDLSVCRVNHKQFPYGISLTTKDGFKLVYSGDTRPCKNLTKIGYDCDLLIHEATFWSKDKERAYEKFHSTTEEAIQVGKNMKARFTILTHFSQRYKEIFEVGPKSNVSYAFDFMKVRPCDLHQLPVIEKAIRVLFEEKLHDRKHDLTEIK